MSLSLIEKYNVFSNTRNSNGRVIPTFGPGCTIKVTIASSIGDDSKKTDSKKRTTFSMTGLCIAVNDNLNIRKNPTFRIRIVNDAHPVERVFPVFGKSIIGIEILGTGKVRRGKLYYMRNLRGKSTRLRQKIRYSTSVSS